MAHSFVEYRNRRILLNDAHIVIVVHLVLQAAKAAAAQCAFPHGVQMLLRSWESILDSSAAGALDTDLDTFIGTPQDHATLLSLLTSAKTLITRWGQTVPGEYLNRLIAAPNLFDFVDRPSAEITDAIDVFVGVLGQSVTAVEDAPP